MRTRKKLLLLLVLVISATMGQGVAESLVVDEALVVWLGELQELLELVVVESVGLALEDLLKSLDWHDALVLLVKKLESLDDNVLWVGTVELIGQHVQEDGEVDWSTGLSAHVVEHVLVEVSNAEGGVGGLEIADGNDTVSIGVDHLEGLLELLDLALLELREDIGSGSLLLATGFLCHFEERLVKVKAKSLE